MKLEKFSFSEKKAGKWFLYGFVLCAVLMVVLDLFTSKAKYRTTQSIPLVRGKISYKPADLNVVAMYQENESGEYENVDAIPSSGYTLNSTESYCEVNKVKDESITMEYANGLVNFNGISKKGTKCYLYFDKKLGNTMSEILAGYTKSTRTDFTTAYTESTTKTVFTAQDDDGTSYYYAGAATDNYVQFAGYYWRIIRINGDGSIRLIYEGPTARANGVSSSDTQIGTSTFNSSADDNMYVGYMYTSGNVHGTGTSSAVKNVLDDWYSKNLVNYASYIDVNAGFCGDRTPYTNNDGTTSGGGTGTTTTYYGANIRLSMHLSPGNSKPSLKCANSGDLYTTENSSKGNNALTYPIGLINADEVLYANGYNSSNNSCYLYTGQNYWTMTPSLFGTKGYVIFVYYVGGLTHIGNLTTNNGVRPVINLKADTAFLGSGTSSDPFTPVSV